MTERRQGAAAVIMKNMPWVCGGHDGVSCLRTVECLEPAGRAWLEGGKDGKWKACPMMITPRYCLSACVAAHGGGTNPKAKVFCFGGHDGVERLGTGECGDDGDWESVPKNPPREGQARLEPRAGAALA